MRWLILILLVGCVPRTPTPPTTSHEDDVPMPVPYPPPAPRVEELGERPSETALWVDGQWHWDGAGYAWQSGTWIEPRSGWRYAPPTLVRRRNGELLYYEGVWKEIAQRPEREEGASP